MNEMNGQNESMGYQDPIATPDGKPAKKKVSGSTIAATVGAVVLYFLFGIIGAAICYAGYWAVRAIAKSKMPLAVRVVLGIIVGLIFVILLIAFILLSIGIQSNL